MKKVIKKTKEYTYSLVPELVSASDLQRKSGKILRMLKDSTQPYFIVKNNKPTGVIVGIEEYNRLKKIQKEIELKDVLKIIKDGENELKNGKVKELKGSIYNLWKDLQENNND
jgi:prevent-host-death family protein